MDVNPPKVSELSAHTERLTVAVPTADNAKMAALLTMIAAYGRLMELERRRNGWRDKFRPLDPADHAEYVRLRQWWVGIGSDKQDRLTAVVDHYSREVEVLSRFF